MEIEIDLAPGPNPDPLEPHSVQEHLAFPTTGRDILAAAAAVAGITVDLLVSKDRHRAISRPRQVAIWLIRRDLGWSFPYIGRLVGNRDHTTIMASCRCIDDLKTQGDVVTLRLIAAVERRAPGLASCEPVGPRLVRTA